MVKNVRCSYCDNIKTIDGYEEYDEYGLWFCSYDCDNKHKLKNYYF